MPITIKEDFASGRAEMVDAGKHLESVEPSPDGKRVIAVARGDLFSVPGQGRFAAQSFQYLERA